MSNQTSAAATLEYLAMVLADQYKAGMPIEAAKRVLRETCRLTYKQPFNQIDKFDKAWARFQGRVRKI